MANNAEPQTDNIDQIREIIFGNQSREFQSEIHNLNERIQKNRKELEGRISALETQINSRLDELTQMMQRQHEQLVDKLDDFNSDNATQLEQERARTDERLETLQAVTEGEMGDIKKEMRESGSDLSDELQRIQALIEAALERDVNDLEERKVSKDEMSQLLLDLAMQVKGVAPDDEASES